MFKFISTFNLLVCLALVGSPVAFAKEVKSEGQVLRTVQGVDILDTEKVEYGGPVRVNTVGEYGAGVLIGRPVKFSYKGVFFDTYELEIYQGGFMDASQYIGAVISASTDDGRIFTKFKSLDQNTQYVFTYKYINPLNPEIEDSHLQITEIYTVEEYVQLKNLKSIPSAVTTRVKYQGSISNGSDNERSGRIVDVARYGLIDDFCTIELNLGGVRDASGHGSSEALVVMAVLDENVCAYAENILPLAQDVHVNYSEDWIEVWNPSDRFVNGIKLSFSEGSAEPKAVAAIPVAAKKDIEALKQILLKDPEFLKQLAEELRKRQ